MKQTRHSPSPDAVHNGDLVPHTKAHLSVIEDEEATKDTSAVAEASLSGLTLSNVLWKIMLIVGVLVYGSYGVLVHLCETDGKVPFSSSAMVLVTEMTKLVISLTLLIATYRQSQTPFTMPSIRYILSLSVPAILYTINNNLGVHMQMQMDPTTYQVLGNMKTATTAILYRLIMKRELSKEKWCAIGLLLSAGVFNSYGGYIPSKSESLQPDTTDTMPSGNLSSLIHITLNGIMMMIPYCFISGFAGVYTEYVLKSSFHHSIHLQNSILYTFGIILNFGSWFSHARVNTSDPHFVMQRTIPALRLIATVISTISSLFSVHTAATAPLSGHT